LELINIHILFRIEDLRVPLLRPGHHILCFSNILLPKKIHVEVSDLVICDMINIDVTLEALIKQLVVLGLLISCHLHWRIIFIRLAGHDLSCHLLIIDFLIDVSQQKIRMVTTVWVEVG